MLWGYIVCTTLGLIVGTLLGIRMAAIKINEKANVAGTLLVLTDDADKKKYFALDLDMAPEEIEKLIYVSFVVKNDGKL